MFSFFPYSLRKRGKRLFLFEKGAYLILWHRRLGSYLGEGAYLSMGAHR